jgi:DTW domain-containing protein YfiP
MLGALCVCDLIPRVPTRTRVVLFIHRSEDLKSTNTGRLATECLPNSEVLVRGQETHENPRFTCHSDELPLLLFPHEGATPLTEFVSSAQPLVLIVPDGTWRQASKVRNRVPGLEGVRCVSLPAGPPSAYRLRFEAHRDGLATMEAIARALGILEGDHIQRALDNVFRAVVERTLWSRGSLGKSDVVGPLPSGIMRHDPRRR